MRVTAEKRQATRARILQEARALFASKGWDGTTTRDIARETGIASGTLFNYFPAKESLGLALMEEALGHALHEHNERKGRSEGSLHEALFALIMTGLRHLQPMRKIVGAVAEAALSPFGEDRGDAADLRRDHLDAALRLISSYGTTNEPSHLVMHTYWTLYVSVLNFWSNDESPNQEDTLAFLDYVTQMFASSIHANRDTRENEHGT